MSDERSPDMIWYTCLDCTRQFTLADMDNGCPHCASPYYKHYDESDELLSETEDPTP